MSSLSRKDAIANVVQVAYREKWTAAETADRIMAVIATYESSSVGTIDSAMTKEIAADLALSRVINRWDH